MPYLNLQTNLKLKDEAKENLASDITQLLSKELSKPAKYIMAAIEDNVFLIFNAKSEPAAYVELKSINLPEDATKKLSEAVCLFLERHLKISPDRIYIEFTNAKRHMWGYNNTTF